MSGNDIENVLNAELKESAGKGMARSLRRKGMVPCIIYGDEKTPTMVTVDSKVANSLCSHSGFYSKTVKIAINNGISVVVLPKVVQFHPVSGAPLHIDFQRVSSSHRIKLKVPVEFINAEKSPSIKLGGVLNIVAPFVELLCSPLSIPEKFEIDLDGAIFGKSFLVKDITIPNDCSLSHGVHPETVLATIVQPQRGGIEEEGAGAEVKTEANA
jgi:large subunit ribosomal protein L25